MGLKRTMETEKVELKEQEQVEFAFDLSSEEDRKKLEQEFTKQSSFFKPESDVTYKVQLTSPKVSEVIKEFGDDKVLKYVLNIQASNKDGETFTGTWEVGKSVLEPIFKGYEANATFKITKTGSGKDTRYSVVKDF